MHRRSEPVEEAESTTCIEQAINRGFLERTLRHSTPWQQGGQSQSDFDIRLFTVCRRGGWGGTQAGLGTRVGCDVIESTDGGHR